MPRSKRSKVVTLARTQKRGTVRKDGLIERLRTSLDEYAYVYVFSFENLRTTYLKDVRDKWEASRFYLGKNKVLQVGLGRSASEERYKDVHFLGKHLTGNRGLFFTNSPKEDVLSFFNTYKQDDHARSGFAATQTVTVPEGPLVDWAHSLEPLLKKLGMPTRLVKGVIHVDREWTVCKEGQPVTPEQAKILKLMDIKMSEFKITMLYMWSKDSESVEQLLSDEEIAAATSDSSSSSCAQFHDDDESPEVIELDLNQLTA
eukprot:TRINITY_DN283_c0_g1_i1.p1 TRINITY_DN283_c0_g1~~TRINITY_DN283_c0_g1_i1.p1  ORF type:complete len:259 (-),score=53.79 TRINITY_DN283_c0_g1_i1:22-798(-)